MKNHFLKIVVVMLFIHTYSFGQVGIGTTTPNASSILDITSTTAGLLTPRMTETQKNAIVSPATGLLIYQTNATAGYYYYNGTVWTPFGSSGWSLTGNAGTLPVTNFIGTTDAQDFVIKANGTEAMRVKNGGNVAVGNNNPSAKLHITGTSVPASAGGTVTLLNQNFNAAYTVVHSNNGMSGCSTPATNGWERTTTGNTNANCTSCTSGWLYIYSDETGCGQNATATIDFTTPPTSTTVTISFAYRYNNFSATGDSFRTYLYDNTTNSQVGANLVGLLTADANTSYSGTATVVAGNSYSLRFEYIGNYDYGASIDNVLVTETGLPTAGTYVFRLEDGTQALGKVLTSDASGNASWGTASGTGSQSLSISGSNLSISGGNTVALPTGTDSQNLSISGSNLSISGGNTVALPTGTDSQNLSISGSTLTISGGNSVTLPSSGSYTFTNGLTETTGTVRLGGALTQDTALTLGTYDLSLNASGLGDFKLQKVGADRIIFDNYGDLRIDSDTRTHAMHMDAGYDFINFGSSAIPLSSDGTTFTDSGSSSYTIDFVLGADNGSSGGTAVQLGSIEYVVDGTAEWFSNYSFSPLTDGNGTLGTSNHRWSAVYAQSGIVNTSDANLKKNIAPLNYGLKEIMLLEPVTYKWKNNTIGKTTIPENLQETKIGFLAQDLLKIVPEVVKTHDWRVTDEKLPDTYNYVKNQNLGVMYSDIIPVAVKAIQEQQAQIEDLKKEIAELKALVKAFKK